MSQEKIVLFYTSIPRSFRTSLIGHLVEINRKYPVVLLSEKLSPDVEKLLENKNFFPNLMTVVPVRQYTGEIAGVLTKNRELAALAKKIIHAYLPAAVITANDMYPFEMYLLREAKKIGALNICIQPAMAANIKKTAEWLELTNAYLYLPTFLPLWLKIFLIKTKKLAGHFIYYWILPLFAGEKPFRGKSSRILIKGESGMRDADYQVVFSASDKNIHEVSGVPIEKLIVLAHPLTRETKMVFEALSSLKNLPKPGSKIALLTVSGDIEIGFKAGDLAPISKKERLSEWLDIIKIIRQELPDWAIYVSLHPATKNFENTRKELSITHASIKVLDRESPIEAYVGLADLIVGLPLSASTILFAALLQNPEKPILSLDTYGELMGDYYKNFEGIDYIPNERDLVLALTAIKNNQYHKTIRSDAAPENFKDTAELLDYVLNKKYGKRN